MRYDYRPGSIGPGRHEWPSESPVTRSGDKTTVVAFIHPRCVCTGATVTELIDVMRKNAGADLVAVAFIPTGHESEPEWSKSRYFQSIQAEVPNARLFLDLAGNESNRFGVSTSGTILAFDSAGKEVFRGGITGGRGVAGDNLGRRRLEGVLAGSTADWFNEPTPVFGCAFNSCTRDAAPSSQGGAP
jgi:hypothetical protein